MAAQNRIRRAARPPIRPSGIATAAQWAQRWSVNIGTAEADNDGDEGDQISKLAHGSGQFRPCGPAASL